MNLIKNILWMVKEMILISIPFLWLLLFVFIVNILITKS